MLLMADGSISAQLHQNGLVGPEKIASWGTGCQAGILILPEILSSSVVQFDTDDAQVKREMLSRCEMQRRN